MISDVTELGTTLAHMTKLADTLEGLRLYAQETGETALLPLSAAGPLTHLRESLAGIRAFTERLSAPEASQFATANAMLRMGDTVITDSERALELTAR